LYYVGTQIAVNKLTSLQSIRHLLRLKDLNAYGNNITNIRCLRNLTQLTSLELGDNPLEGVIDVGTLTNLKVLVINTVDPVNVALEIRGLDFLTSLRELDIDNDLYPPNIARGEGFAQAMVKYAKKNRIVRTGDDDDDDDDGEDDDGDDVEGDVANEGSVQRGQSYVLLCLAEFTPLCAAVADNPRKKCLVVACKNELRAKNLCKKHYDQKLHGSEFIRVSSLIHACIAPIQR
jgi:hypothetical protein